MIRLRFVPEYRRPRFVPTVLLYSLLAVLPSCSNHRSAYAVGTTLTESMLSGPCSYEAPEGVAHFDPTTKLTTLVGPGLLVSTCSGARVEWDVVKPTGLRIDGDETPLSGSPHRFVVQATLLAGARELSPSWCVDYKYTLGLDCAGVATIELHTDPHPMFCPISGVVIETAPGACTVEATVLGLHATRALHLR